MHAYCVEVLHLSEDAAYKRIQAARAARRFPALLDALAEGRLHLAAARLLAPRLTAENGEELIVASTHRKKSEVEEWLARRFGLPEVPAREKLRYAQALLRHAVPDGNLAQVLDRALDALILQLEKRKLGGHSGAGSSPGHPRRPIRRRTTKRTRYIPANVRRAVWERDGGRCTFVGASGHRCNTSRLLEFDHADPVARGGTATVDGVRLRCRAHNQYEAERAFGAAFMSLKRQEARLAVAESRAHARAREQTQDVLAALRGLGCRTGEARRAAEFAETLGGDTLGGRMRAALEFLGGRSLRSRRPEETSLQVPQHEGRSLQGRPPEG